MIDFFNRKLPLVLDGPIGTLLIEYGEKLNTPIWSAELLITNSQLIQKIHQEYVEAGCDILTTNTFRTNPYALEGSSSNFSSEQLVKIAIDLARKTANKFSQRKIFIAGSNAPAADCYATERILSTNELFSNHKEHIEALASNGADFILNETFGDRDEIEIACKICSEKKFPFAVSVLAQDEHHTFLGQDLEETFELIFYFKPIFISLNCSRPEVIINSLPLLKKYSHFGVYPNLGSVESFNTSKLVRDYSFNKLSEFIRILINNNVSVIGVCCGGNPTDISLIRRTIDSTTEAISSQRSNENI